MCNVYNFDPKIRGSSLKEDILRCLNEIVRGARFMQTDIKDVFRLPSNQKVRPVVIKLASMELKKINIYFGCTFQKVSFVSSPRLYFFRFIGTEQVDTNFGSRAYGRPFTSKAEGCETFRGG